MVSFSSTSDLKLKSHSLVAKPYDIIPVSLHQEIKTVSFECVWLVAHINPTVADGLLNSPKICSMLAFVAPSHPAVASTAACRFSTAVIPLIRRLFLIWFRLLAFSFLLLLFLVLVIFRQLRGLLAFLGLLGSLAVVRGCIFWEARALRLEECIQGSREGVWLALLRNGKARHNLATEAILPRHPRHCALRCSTARLPQRRLPPLLPRHC